MSRFATSPANEQIEIISDAEWIARVHGKETCLKQMNLKMPVIQALWVHGEQIASKGTAMTLLHDLAQPLGYKGARYALNALMTDGVNRPAFTRDIKGKRTYRVALVRLPERWFNKLLELPPIKPAEVIEPPAPVVETVEEFAEPAPVVETVEEYEPTPVVETVEEYEPTPVVETVPIWDEPPVELHIAQSVAMAMLTQVVEIIGSGSPVVTDQRLKVMQNDLSEVQQRLAQRLQESDTYRKRLRELGDELVAVRYERDGLRDRLRLTEANLARAMSADNARLVRDEVHKHISTFMSAKPESTKGPINDHNAKSR